MALARVVSFDEVSTERMDALTQDIQGSEAPAEIPATEIVMLHDRDTEKALVVLFFETEDDYRRGDEVLSAMPSDETPGRRSSVGKFDVALRMAR